MEKNEKCLFIKNYRCQLGLTQSEFCEKFFVSRSSLCKLESLMLKNETLVDEVLQGICDLNVLESNNDKMCSAIFIYLMNGFLVSIDLDNEYSRALPLYKIYSSIIENRILDDEFMQEAAYLSTKVENLVYLYQGISYFNMNKYPEAIKYLNKSNEINDELNLKGITLYYLGKSHLYMMQSFDASIEYYNLASSIFDKTFDYKRKLQIQIDKISFDIMQGNSHEALRRLMLLKEGIKGMIHEEELISKIDNLTGFCYLMEGDLESARCYFECGHEADSLVSNSYLIILHTIKDNYSEALKYLDNIHSKQIENKTNQKIYDAYKKYNTSQGKNVDALGSIIDLLDDYENRPILLLTLYIILSKHKIENNAEKKKYLFKLLKLKYYSPLFEIVLDRLF